MTEFPDFLRYTFVICKFSLSAAKRLADITGLSGRKYIQIPALAVGNGVRVYIKKAAAAEIVA